MKKLPQKEKGRKRKLLVRIFFLSLLLYFFVIQFLNHTGFCYEERRYLSDEEIISRVVEMGRWKIPKDSYKKNPYCCRMLEKPFLLSNSENFILKVFGEYRNDFEIYYKYKENKHKNEYRKMEIISTNACADKVYESAGMDLLKKEYEYHINLIKENSNK